MQQNMRVGTHAPLSLPNPDERDANATPLTEPLCFGEHGPLQSVPTFVATVKRFTPAPSNG
jgi:hypothetical protein